MKTQILEVNSNTLAVKNINRFFKHTHFYFAVYVSMGFDPTNRLKINMYANQFAWCLKQQTGLKSGCTPTSLHGFEATNRLKIDMYTNQFACCLKEQTGLKSICTPTSLHGV